MQALMLSVVLATGPGALGADAAVEARIARLEAQNAELQARLERLELTCGDNPLGADLDLIEGLPEAFAFGGEHPVGIAGACGPGGSQSPHCACVSRSLLGRPPTPPQESRGETSITRSGRPLRRNSRPAAPAHC